MSAHQDSAVEVLDCDREAAKSYLQDYFHPTEVMAGDADPHWLVQTFARHRITATATLREQRDELLEALEDVRSRIAASDEWWMECHDRGGFDTDQIDAAIAKARGA